MEAGGEWKSPRRLREEMLARQVAAFDRLVDLALDGTIEMSEAIEAYKFQDANGVYLDDEPRTA